MSPAAQIITMLFNSIIFVMLLSYIPQVYTVYKSKGRCEEISLTTLGMWSYSSIIQVLYAALLVSDILLVVQTGVTLVFNLLILSLTLFKRHTVQHDDDALVSVTFPSIERYSQAKAA